MKMLIGGFPACPILHRSTPLWFSTSSKRTINQAPRSRFDRVIHRHSTGGVRMTKHNRLQYAAIAVALASTGLAYGAGQGNAGGATTTAKPMPNTLTSITQPMLNAAGSDAKNWI